MDQWQVLLERFLRNECTERENRLVYHALRNGLIDDELCRAIDTFMNDSETLTRVDCMEPAPDIVLKNIRFQLAKREEKPVGVQRRSTPE